MAAHTMLHSTTQIPLEQAITHNHYSRLARADIDIDLAWVATALLMDQTRAVKEDKVLTLQKDSGTTQQRTTMAIRSTSKRWATKKEENMMIHRQSPLGAN